MNGDPASQSYHHRRQRANAHLISRFQRYKLLLARKWWLLLLGVVLGVGGGWAVAYFGPPAYISVGRMIVNIKLSIPEGSVYSEEMSSFLGTQSALMQSGAVMNRAQARVAAQHPNLTPCLVTLRVSVVPKTTIFVLQGTGENPEYTEAFVQACMEEYIQVKREMRLQTSDTTVAGLTEEVLRLEKELRKADEELAAFQSTNSIVLLQDQGNSAANYLVALNQRLAALKSEHALLQTLTLDQNVERERPIASALPSETGRTREGENDYLKAKQQLLLLKAEQEELGQYLRPKHPKMIAMSEEIARRERLLEIYRQQSAEQLESRKTSLALQIENLEKDVKEWDAKTLEINTKSAEYQKLRANSQRIQSLYDRLLATMQTLDVNKEISPESVTIMERASPPIPAKPTLGKQLLTGGLLGLAASLGLLLLLDRLDDRMASFTELQDLFDEEVLGQIPREKTRGPRRELPLIQEDDPRHGYLEAYRNLRSSLLYMGEGGRRPKTILVTSAVPNDGKSLTSANLAITMAAAGSGVLLVDADLRKGNLHHQFGVADQPGLSEVLLGTVRWEQAVQPTRIPNLSLLPRGTPTQRSSEFFVRNLTTDLLKEISAKYEYVILDTAPVMAADDVTSLAPLVDGVVFVIRAEQTSARVARAALDLLYQRQVEVLGLVFNGVRPSSRDYYYYKYDDYYRPYPQKRAETV
ncbi:MAG TPA: polysaccharide biosynthesis tyrosine autokinase [Candidatus Paceibacterota bacterium]|nr:polysaccharide biosynthesis tyrosine autokinase [Candidatus Paceibacterota bacterium]HRT58313.1 polysaccharide biosynthesis tyrosine autokinase [Candidatus Paceibacterota bacterium]